jgi:peptidoglycan hydrolase-like protein with peptidoglycan-binding domain
MAAVLTIGLQHVRSEFNDVFPHRDKTSDGWIGDTRHQAEKSGHNPDRTGNAEYRDGDSLDEVRAIDVDKDLRDASGKGVTMEKVVQYLVAKARSGAYVPFRYIIFNRRIWERSTGWKTRAYTGSNPHDQHLHLSGDYTQTADNWTGKVGLASLVQTSKPKPPSGGGGKPASGLPHYADGSRENSQSKNNVGTDVATLQRFIGSEHCGAADGHFGPNTTKGVRWYQDMRGLHVDGVAGPKTWAPILKAIK